MSRLTDKKLKAACGYFVNFASKEEAVKYRMLAESAPKYEEIYRKLADYEDKEEQGLLIELPCKVGDIVFLICSRYTKCTEHGVEFDDYFCGGCECLECDSRREYYIHENHSVSLEWIVRYLNDFGVRVFLTRSEAEEALAKMGGKEQ